MSRDQILQIWRLLPLQFLQLLHHLHRSAIVLVRYSIPIPDELTDLRPSLASDRVEDAIADLQDSFFSCH